jgi:ATP-dependent Clp protease ATP-binding subunit ClpX
MSEKLFKVLDESIYFKDAQEAQVYAKNHPGKVITRNNSGELNAVTPKKSPVIFRNSPNEILAYLNRFIVSQDEAKKDISLAMYYHHLNTQYAHKKEVSSNGPLTIVGPTGTGKTFIVKKACEYLDAAFIHVDTASLVPEGILGFSIHDVVKEVLRISNYDIKKAEHSVIFFDEFDKLFTDGTSTLDYGARIADQLLRMIEGTTLNLRYTTTELEVLPNRIKTLDTKNIQFIFGGAFQWIIDQKLEKKSTVGFRKASKENTTHLVTLEDLYRISS